MPGTWGKKSKEIVDGTAVADKPERISNKLEHVLVAESKSQPTQYIKKFFRNKRYLRLAGITIAGLAALSTVAVYVGREKPTEPVASSGPKCTYRMLEAAKANFDETKVAQLESQTKEIESIAGYDQDVNCLYVVLTYYINLSDPTKSREVYNKLAAIYNAREGYETIIADVALAPERVKPKVEAVEQLAKQYDNIDFSTGAPR